jgi:hypothetical protein
MRERYWICWEKSADGEWLPAGFYRPAGVATLSCDGNHNHRTGDRKMADIEYAVEINTTQAKKAGATSNLYIVQGRDVVFYHTSRYDKNAIRCEITTRERANKNRIGYLASQTVWRQQLVGSPIAVDGFDPRPSLQYEWTKVGNRWFRKQ